MISRESLKGYILEEILAFLIRNTGYKLLVDPIQDPRELKIERNGLVVKGRGAFHQADVLGQLAWIPAFTFPLRLFVEAKCKKDATGISEVRNAVGVLEDINQNYSPVREGKTLLKRFTYRYVIFSTSGFTSMAADMALAHQISLVDLSGPDFMQLGQSVEQIADIILQDISSWVVRNGNTGSRNIIKLIRLFLRDILKTWPLGLNNPLNDKFDSLQEKIPNINLIRELLEKDSLRYGEFFVGMANGPFLLVFKSDEAERFLAYAEQRPSHNITITWTRRNNLERQWTIRPIVNPEAYSLSFGLPQTLGDWIFGDEERATHRAWSVKEEFFSDITIYRHVHGQDRLFRLTYDSNKTRQLVNTI